MWEEPISYLHKCKSNMISKANNTLKPITIEQSQRPELKVVNDKDPSYVWRNNNTFIFLMFFVTNIWKKHYWWIWSQINITVDPDAEKSRLLEIAFPLLIYGLEIACFGLNEFAELKSKGKSTGNL